MLKAEWRRSHAQSGPASEEIRPGHAEDHRARGAVSHGVWRADLSQPGRGDRLPAAQRQSRDHNLQAFYRSRRRAADSGRNPEAHARADALHRALKAEVIVSV